MNGEKTNLKSGNPIWVLLIFTAIATLLSIFLALRGHKTAAAIIATATFFLWLSLIVVTTAVIVSWWSAKLMERGAQIALTAQVSDDKRDVAMIGALSKLAEWREARPDQLALPLPSEPQEYLPRLTEFTEGDFEEMN